MIRVQVISRVAAGAAAAAAVLGGPLVGVASAEHVPTPSQRRAITAVLTNNGRFKARIVSIRVSSRGPYALAHEVASGQVGWTLLQRRRGRWRDVATISDEGLRCDQAPQSVIRDLHLLRYADGGRCIGPSHRRR